MYEVDVSYGGSKAARVQVSKIHINEKINIRMKKKLKNQCLVRPMW
jgi:hypothetical protein